ncbi:hypothetical protein [Micromonospora sp. MH99]|nr:hypothetical protein [Micromonospora sp. MH99]
MNGHRAAALDAALRLSRARGAGVADRWGRSWPAWRDWVTLVGLIR